jgi:hypothetical protein
MLQDGAIADQYYKASQDKGDSEVRAGVRGFFIIASKISE